MKILVINCGSSSLKYQLIDSETEIMEAKGLCERIGIDGRLTHEVPGKDKYKVESPMPDHTAAMNLVMEALQDPEHGVIKSTDEISAIGHRVLHGGPTLTTPMIVDQHVKDVIRDCFDLGPLHNPANLKGVNAVKALLPNIPQVGVFDTAFHQTMPDYAYMYPLPYEYYEKYAIRRYGFHGTSHRYVSQRVCEFLGIKAEGSKIITCHVGNGGSISAVVDGKCIDTTMGLTPLEGLMMGTRCGEIDPAIVPFLMNHEGLSASEMDTIMNKKSGLLGISGVSSDMREVTAAAKEGNKRAQLALNMYYYRIKKYIGQYAAAMGGVDVVLFTGGVGENHTICRAEVCKGLEFMGIKLDAAKNDSIHGEEAIISAADSKVKVVVIPTDEELMIAMDTEALAK